MEAMSQLVFVILFFIVSFCIGRYLPAREGSLLERLDDAMDDDSDGDGSGA